MLPEGAHLHTDDSTLFLIHQDRKPCITAFTKVSAWTAAACTIDVHDGQLCVTTLNSEQYWLLQNANCVYHDDDTVHFPDVFPELAIAFPTVDQRIAFTEMIHDTCMAVRTRSKIPNGLY